jgi:hypothetical protein
VSEQALPQIPTDWNAGYVIAKIWDCGDPECDCIQPRIERVSPNHETGRPWMRRETVWAGTFVSTGYGDWPEGVTFESLVEELTEACKEYPDAIWWVSE